MVGDVGTSELVDASGQDAGDVGGDVAVADDDGRRVTEVGRELAEVGVAVVPTDEGGGGHRAGKVLARDSERLVGLSPDRVDDRVVALGEVRMRDVFTHPDVSEEPATAAEDRLVEGLVELLDRAVIGRHACPQQPPGGRQPLEDIDVEPLAPRVQLRDGERAGRPRADDRDLETLGHQTASRSLKNSAFRSVESWSRSGTSASP